MNAAAAEACRMLATRPVDFDGGVDVYEEVVRRRLGAIPQQENFHCHQDGCSWEIELSGDEQAAEVRVCIAGKVRPLPLLDVGARLLGATDAAGDLGLSVEVSAPTQDAWVAGSELGLKPSSWVEAWK